MANKKKGAEVIETPAQPAFTEPYGLGVVNISGTFKQTFGILDRKGDLIPRRERTFHLDAITPQAFNELLQAVEAFRCELLEEFCLPAPLPGPPPLPPASTPD